MKTMLCLPLFQFDVLTGSLGADLIAAGIYELVGSNYVSDSEDLFLPNRPELISSISIASTPITLFFLVSTSTMSTLELSCTLLEKEVCFPRSNSMLITDRGLEVHVEFYFPIFVP